MTVKQQIRPLGNRVLVKRLAAQTSKGGILLPESAKEKPKQGEVIAVGPGKADEKGNVKPMTVQVGDCVLFSSYAGTEIQSGEDHLILSEDDILGILN